MSKECYITLIKSIRLESVKFILPKRLSSPKIVHTICLINEGNFPITYTMFVIFKMCVKWRLFDGIPFNEIPMGCLLIVKSRSETFRTICVLLRTCFAWKKIHNIVGTTVQIIGLNAILPLGTKRSKCFSSNILFAYFEPSTSPWSARGFLLFKRCNHRSQKNIFQTFSPTFQCSLSMESVFQIVHFKVSKALDDQLY